MLDLEPISGPLHIRRPTLGEPLVEAVGAPVLGALAQAVRGKEEDRLRACQLISAAEILAMGDADSGRVAQLIPEVAVDRAADLGVARHVDVDGRLRLER